MTNHDVEQHLDALVGSKPVEYKAHFYAVLLAVFEIRGGKSPAMYPPDVLLDIIEGDLDQTGAVKAYLRSIAARSAIDAATTGLQPL